MSGINNRNSQPYKLSEASFQKKLLYNIPYAFLAFTNPAT
jgi:hypothetical protein